MKIKQMRHGDVFLRLVKRVPSELPVVERKTPEVILAEGEVTGHAHRVFSADAVEYGDGMQRVVSVPSPSRLDHEDHGFLPVFSGIYEVRRQREYAPDAVRNVAD